MSLVLSHAPRDNSNWVKAGSAVEGDFYVDDLCRMVNCCCFHRRIPYYMYPIISHIADRNRITLIVESKSKHVCIINFVLI